MDHHSSTKNLSTNGNQDQEEEINYTKTQNINQNQKSDDENNASKPIQVRNKVNNKNVADAISIQQAKLTMRTNQHIQFLSHNKTKIQKQRTNQ